MYNTEYECRYFKEDVFLDTDNISDEEKDYVRNILYREDLLHIFNIDSSNVFEIFDVIFSELYNKIKENDFLKECIEKVASKIMIIDDEIGICILYSYDYMYLTHKCISEYLKKGVISEENMNLLKECISN
jgi:hypothetical protein